MRTVEGGVGGGKGQESIEEGSEMGWWICGVERSRIYKMGTGIKNLNSSGE